MNSNPSHDLQQQLAQLRDIRLPEQIGWWPLAPGWWMITTVVLLCILLIVYLQYKQRTSLKYVALKELEQLKQQSHTQPISLLATRISVLIRRVILSVHLDAQYASTYGPKWQEFLSTSSRTTPASFTTLISLAPYASAAEIEKMANEENISSCDLIDMAHRWIRGYA